MLIRLTFVFSALFAGLLSAGMSQAQTDSEQGLSLKRMVELQKLTVTGERLDPKQELALRTLSWALDQSLSYEPEDGWKPYCWFTETYGRPLLRCSVMAMVNYRRPTGIAGTPVSFGLPPELWDKYREGQLYWGSRYGVNPRKLDKLLEKLGTPKVNREVVRRALKTGEVPKNLPLQWELDRFADALAQVRRINAVYEPRIEKAEAKERKQLLAEFEQKQADAIEAAGLTVQRYNEISSYVERYQTMQAQVQKLLAGR